MPAERSARAARASRSSPPGDTALVRDRVGTGPEPEDRVVRRLDPVDEPGRVEDEVISLVGRRADLEEPDDHALARSGPLGRGIVGVVAGTGDLDLELEADGTTGEAPVELLGEVVGPERSCLPPAEISDLERRLPRVADVALPALG